jgi:UDP-glucose 4-epimerase
MTINKAPQILIAGGAGYIGSHMNKELNKNGYRTIIVDNLSAGHREFAQWGEFHQCDLGDSEGLRSVFAGRNISAVMHFCAFTYVGESVEDPQKYYINNVKNTINLLQVMREFDVKQFIFSSTAAIFGDPVTIPIAEEHPREPINPYGRSKLMIEQILADYARAYDLRYVALRYFNAAGADPDCDVGEWHEPEAHLIPLVLDAALGVRENIAIFGTDYETEDGTCVRDYIHVADLAGAHIKALEHLAQGGESDAFNLGNGKGFSVREIIDSARKVTGKEIPTVEKGRRAGDPAVLIADSARAMSVLKWKPVHADIGEIIDTAWRWHQKLYEKYKK